MNAAALVSICIPAWERTDLLLEAVKSCLAQTYPCIEVVIADDSRSDRVGHAVKPLLGDERVRYSHNPERLGQAGNVNHLFDLARGNRLMLLHDDDLLLPDAVESLDRCWQQHPGLVAAYGKQAVITHAGQPLPDASRNFDESYHRTADRAGLQKSKLWAALVEQMPPDGALISTEAARSVRFRSQDEVGDDCDYDFIARLAQQPGGFYFVDRAISLYRLTDQGVASEKTIDHSFHIARDLQLPPELEPVRRKILRSRVSYAVRCHLASGQRDAARELILNPDYWGSPRSRARMISLLLMYMPAFAIRALNTARRIVGKTLRRNDAIYRLIGRLRPVR